MKNKSLKTALLTSIIIFIPALLGIVLYDKLPQQLPTHFNFSGEIDGYTPKLFAILGLPAFLCVVNLLVLFALKNDPKNQEGQNSFMMNLGIWTCPIVSNLLLPATYYIALGHSLNINMIVTTLIAILFIVIGNYFPKCKQNYTMGIRLPWTLNSEVNWNRTHRFAGGIWICGGIILFCSNFIPNTTITFITFITDLIVITLIPMVYSYILYRKGI